MERRHFVFNVSVGLTALQVDQLIPQELQTKKPLGVQLYTVRDAVAKDLEGSLERLRSLGYKRIEIFGYNGTFFGKTVKEFKTILRNTDLKVISSHHLSGLEPKCKGTLLDGWEKAVEDLDTIGACYMVCPFLFPEERTPKNYKALPGILEKAAKTANAAGLKFAYHNHDFEFEKFEDTLVYDHLINNTDSELVKMEMDLYWISKAGYDPLDYFEKYPGRFPLWHVKDMEEGTKAITEVGSGTIDFDRIFAQKKKAGLEYWFVEQDSGKRDMFESLKMSRDYVNQKKY